MSSSLGVGVIGAGPVTQAARRSIETTVVRDGVEPLLRPERHARLQTKSLWTGQNASVSWDAQCDKQVFVKLEPHGVVRRGTVRHVVQRTGLSARECVGEPVPIPLESEHRCGQVCADDIGTLAEFCESVQDPGVVGRVGVVIQCRDTVDGSHLPCRAEIEQFRVEHEKVVVRFSHRGSGAGCVQLVRDPQGILGAASLGKTPPTEVTRNMRDKAGHREIDQLGFNIRLREARRFGHAGEAGEPDAAKRVEHQQISAGRMGRVRHVEMLHR
jgi:hypothetical protein